MESLIEKLKRKLGRARASHEGRRVVVAAFGKHPGWDDHMEDIGLEPDMLVAAKRLLYLRGIGENIDSGRWSDLEARHSSIEFGHTFVWCRNEAIIAGRLWPSQDGRGRTRYPMIVCAYCRKVPLRMVYERVLRHLEDLETKCRRSTSAAEVRAFTSECQRALSAFSDTLDVSENEQAPPMDPVTRLAAYSELDPGEESLLRVLYQIDRDMTAGSLPLVVKGTCQYSALARVPVSADHVPEAPLLWAQLLLDKYGPECGVLVLIPRGKTWLDLIVGEPTPAQLYCLRAPMEDLLPATAVPYTISPEFAENVRGRLAAARTHAVKTGNRCRAAENQETK
jgi:hypothetical protein